MQRLASMRFLGKSQPDDRAPSSSLPVNAADKARGWILDKHLSIAEGMFAFVRDFVVSLDQTLENINVLVDIVRSMDAQLMAFDTESQTGFGETKIQVWALAVGIKVAVPEVSKELKQHLEELDSIRQATANARAELQKKILVSKDIQDLRAEREKLLGGTSDTLKKASSSATLSPQKRQQLEKSEKKITEVRQMVEELDRGIDVQVQRGRTSLMTLINGIAQAVSCGWYVSTGAVVCRSIQWAEAREASTSPDGKGAEASSAAPADQPRRGASDVWGERRGYARLPFIPPSSEFDPAHPLSEDVSMPKPSGLAYSFSVNGTAVPRIGSTRSTDSGVVREADAELDDWLQAQPVKHLKELLQTHGLTDKGCVEKSDLVAKLRKYVPASRIRDGLSAVWNRSEISGEMSVAADVSPSPAGSMEAATSQQAGIGSVPPVPTEAAAQDEGDQDLEQEPNEPPPAPPPEEPPSKDDEESSLGGVLHEDVPKEAAQPAQGAQEEVAATGEVPSLPKAQSIIVSL